MQVIVEYQGKTYTSRIKEGDPKELSDQFHASPPFIRFRLELENGSFLVMGERAISSAVLIFKQ